MLLKIDGHCVEPRPEQSLLQILRQLGLDGSQLSGRPLAAKIAGEVFTLNYIPVRKKDIDQDRPSMRRAMAASNGEIRLLRYDDEAGKEAYIRSAQFVIFLALRQLWPNARGMVSCTLGSSVFISLTGAEDFCLDSLKQRIRSLIQQDIPLIRRRVPLSQAIEQFRM